MTHDLAIDNTWTVHRLLTEYPETAAVFEQFGIHTCCGGGVPVRDAAVRDGADPDALVEALSHVLRRT